MRTKHFSLLAFALLCSTSVAMASESEFSKRIELDVSSAQELNVSIPAGKVKLVGTSGNMLVTEAKVRCKSPSVEKCQSFLKEMEWSKKIGAKTNLSLLPTSVTDYDAVNIDIKISVPSNRPLNVELTAGELSIENTSACVNANLKAGQLNLKLSEAQLAAAYLHAQVGDVKVTNVRGDTQKGERSLLVGAKLSFEEGKGSCRANAEVMAGEVHLTLY